MKRIMICLLCVLLCISLLPEALAQESGGTSTGTSLNWKSRDVSFETAIALKLEELGLFQGVGKSGDGTADFGLDQQVTRVQAVTMLIRVLGKEAEAEVYPKTHPFTDVPDWADGYVSYAYDMGLTKGVSDTLFGTEDTVTAEMYLTFMLRTLGYTDKNCVNGDDEGDYATDFTWNLPWALASYCGILPTKVDKADFLRADLVDVTCATLYAHMKGSSVLLQDKLSSEGVFTMEQFDAAFSQDPFAYYREIENQISAAIAEKQNTGKMGYDGYCNECHLIVDMYQEDGVIIIKPMVFSFCAEFRKDNTLGTHGGGMGLWLIKLDAETLACLECQTYMELANQGLSWDDIFPGMSEHADDLSQEMIRVCRMETLLLLDSGVIGYRQPTYEEALATITSNLEITQTIETDFCTILIGEHGTPHGGAAQINLIYKPGSVVGEGETVTLPMPLESYWGSTSKPDELWLSDDGQTLYYSYHYDKPLVFEEGTPSERIAHQAGTYRYTTNLSTGETSLSILAE